MRSRKQSTSQLTLKVSPARTALAAAGVAVCLAPACLHAAPEETSALPQLNTATYSSQIFWLLLTFALFYMLIARSVLPRLHEILEKRRHRIESDLGQVERLTQEASRVREAYEQKQEQARRDAHILIQGAQDEVEANRQATFARVDREIAQLLQSAQNDMQAKRRAAVASVTPVAEAVAARLVEELTDTSPDDETVKQHLHWHGT